MTDYSTLAMLRRQYGEVCIPLEVVRRKYFPHIGSTRYLLHVIRSERIKLRVVRSDWGGRTQWVVYLHDLADFLDACCSSTAWPKTDDRSSDQKST